MFGEHDPERYEAEVQERWGDTDTDTDAYAQSQRRTAACTKEDWLRIEAEGEDLMARMAAALRAGVDPDSVEAMDLAEEHRQQITATCYDCPPEMHATLGRMYVEDDRFTGTYEQVAPGLAQWVSTAVQADAARRSPP